MKPARNQIAAAVTVLLLASLFLWSACTGQAGPGGPGVVVAPTPAQAR